MALVHSQLKGILRVGEGKENDLSSVTINPPYGSDTEIDILISSDSRHVFIGMDFDSARKFAESILKVVDKEIVAT